MTCTKGFEVRVTSSSFYNNIYGENNKLNRQLFDVNKQISSGLQIQYAHENPGIYIDTVRLDDELVTLQQSKNSAQTANKISSQTDTTLGDMVRTLDTFKVKLVNAANDVHNDASLQAIAKELRSLKSHLITLANTSLGGHFLFAGTATSQKPIDSNGVYQGNNKDLEAFLGSGIKQKFNISGAQLFLGEENKVNRTVTSNQPQLSLTQQYSDIMQDPFIARNSLPPVYISATNTIRDLMGDTDNITTNDTWQTHFYVHGTKTDGTTFKKQITLNSTDTVDNLLQSISNAYGPNQVNVRMNAHGQIEIQDKQSGSSKLDFHMVGAVDFDPAGLDTANVANIDLLQAGTTNFDNVVGPTATPNLLYVKEFTKSGFTTPAGVTNTIQGINYDRTNFTKNGPNLTSNIPQIIKSDNSYAMDATLLGAVASGTTYDPTNDRFTGLDGKTLRLNGVGINNVPYSVDINLLDAGSTVSGTVNGVAVNFSIKDALDANTDAGKMTYRQLMDVINLVVTNQIPTGAAGDYEAKILSANTFGSVSLDYAGKIVFKDQNAPVTKAEISLYDISTSDYSVTTGSIMTFNANSALTIRDPKKDFFAEIEEMIKSVEEGKKRSDGSDTLDPRNIGIQNAIQKIDDLTDHVSRTQTEAGSYSQTLQASADRSDLLYISTKKLQSEIIDTDIAEATIKMQQLSLNYQALLSNISKVSKLSLVNYL